MPIVLWNGFRTSENQRETSLSLLWFIWTERNSIREEGRRRSAAVIARCIELYMNENVQVIASGSGRVMQCRQRWVRPPEDVLKINCDGSFHQSEKAGSWGFLIRDLDGDVVMAGRGKINNLLNAFQAELVACLQGVQAAIDLGIGHIILETDAREVVKALNSKAYDGSVVGHLVEEIKVHFSLKCH